VLYILLGEDDYSLHQALGEIKRATGDQAMLESNTTILDNREVTLDELQTVCETAPFLAERRLVIVNGLLERFDPKSSSPRRRGKARKAPNRQKEWKSYSDYISNIPESTVLVLTDSKIKSGNPLLKELSAKTKVMSFPPLRGFKLQQWVQSYVKKQGGSISTPAVKSLAELVGSNLWTMANEINKLLSFTSGKRIEEDDVKMVASHTLQANVFAMIDAILGFKTGVAEQSLQQLLQRGSAPAYLLAMLARQLQMIVRVKELRKQRRSESEIQNKLGLPSEFALRKTLEQADKYPSQRLKRVYQKLLETDLSIKTGKYDGELALNILVAELSQ